MCSGVAVLTKDRARLVGNMQCPIWFLLILLYEFVAEEDGKGCQIKKVSGSLSICNVKQK